MMELRSVPPERAELDATRWSRVFDGAGWGIALSSPDGNSLDTVNAELARMHGFTVAELLGRPVGDLFAPGARPDLAEVAERVGELGRWSFEAEHVRKDGTTFAALVNVTLVKDEAGFVMFRAFNVLDITERKRHEEALRAETLSRDVLDRLLEGCQVISFEYRYLYLNDIAAHQARLPKQELLGRTMWDCFPGIDDTPMFHALRRCMTERTCEQIDNEFEFGDGTRIAFDLKFVPVPQGVCILSLDITERRHRLAAIVHDSEDAIMSRTLDGVITSWNRGAERMFGYTASEMLGQPFAMLFPPELEPTPPMTIERLGRGERIAPFETHRLHKDGSLVEVSITLSPYRDSAGEVIGVSMIARDITELKHVQRELVRTKDAAEAANRELEAFAYSVAHDLRAPLRRINAFTEALEEDAASQLDPGAHKHLEAIRASTRLMASLIEDILRLSRLTWADLEHAPVDLSALARAAVARLQLGEPDRRVDIVIPDGVIAHGNARLFAIVLDNLFGNSWKFTATRHGARIELGCATIEGTTTYFVRDNGVGFDQTYASQLFIPFHRLHSAEQFEGTGIGLATVQRIILRHGGRVWAEGEVGHGATIYFALST